MSDKLGLGQIITTEQHRDAIHVAVAPVRSAGLLHPGEHVCRYPSGDYSLPKNADDAKRTVGIVDPFLRSDVRPGQQFWLFLYPGSITSLRHEWEHPAFEKSTSIITAVERIREIAAACDMGYEMLMESARTWLQYGDYTTQLGRQSWRDNFPQYEEEFWKLYEQVEGQTVDDSKRQNFFSCSC